MLLFLLLIAFVLIFVLAKVSFEAVCFVAAAVIVLLILLIKAIIKRKHNGQ